MKIYLLTQTISEGFDTYDSAVVAAPDPESAARIHPNTWAAWDTERNWWGWEGRPEQGAFSGWGWARTPEQVKVTCLGEATAGIEEGLILAKFKPG